jgi:hypothetical protein
MGQVEEIVQKVKEKYQLFCSQNPDITWNGILTKKGPTESIDSLAFLDYFKNKYVLIEKLRVQTNSTARLFYSIYYNEDQNDVRIEKLEYGCFHGREFLISIEDINKTVEFNEKAVPKFLDTCTSIEQRCIGETLVQEMEVLKKVQASYKRLKGIS